MDYKHCAIDITTGLVLNTANGTALKRRVAYTTKWNKEEYGILSQWRFCHDYGQNWKENGAPVK